MVKELIEWEKVSQKLAKFFIKKYYGDDLSDCWWVGEDIGGVLVVNDDFYSLDRIVDAVKFDATYDQLCDYNDYEMECIDDKKEKTINFRNFVKLNRHENHKKDI